MNWAKSKHQTSMRLSTAWTEPTPFIISWCLLHFKGQDLLHWSYKHQHFSLLVSEMHCYYPQCFEEMLWLKVTSLSQLKTRSFKNSDHKMQIMPKKRQNWLQFCNFSFLNMNHHVKITKHTFSYKLFIWRQFTE